MLKFIVTLIALLAAAAQPSFAQDKAQDKSQRGMMRYDTNRDGYVDRNEWSAGQEARFKQLDTDGDGKLSPDELNRRPAGATGVLPSDAANTRKTAFFLRMDTDRDGFVSKPEFMVQADRNFVRCDLNKDGRINADECRQALRRR